MLRASLLFDRCSFRDLAISAFKESETPVSFWSLNVTSIEKKKNGRFLLRYRVRNDRHPTGWRRKAELMEATTEKAARKERNDRMKAINQIHENQGHRDVGLIS